MSNSAGSIADTRSPAAQDLLNYVQHWHNTFGYPCDFYAAQWDLKLGPRFDAALDELVAAGLVQRVRAVGAFGGEQDIVPYMPAVPE